MTGSGPVIALFGPTGVGKTAVMLELVPLLRESGRDAIAISADALQVYEGLELLTGAADAEAQRRVEHQLLSFVQISDTFSVGQFMPMAHRFIDETLEQGRVPIIIGGTGLYLRAALQDLSLRPPPPPGVRERWEREVDAKGPEALHGKLRSYYPDLAATVDPNDRSRLIRLLELMEMGELDADRRQGESELWTADTRRPTLLVGLTMDREKLYARIDARVESMIEAGAAEEVRRAAASASPTARKALGFKELLAGDVDAMKRNTRRYARRQLTWMRKLPNVTLLDVTDREPRKVAEEIRRLYLSAADRPGGKS